MDDPSWGEAEETFQTYGFLSNSLVGFNLQLQFIDQVLESGYVLAVLLSLDENLFRQEL